MKRYKRYQSPLMRSLMNQDQNKSPQQIIEEAREEIFQNYLEQKEKEEFKADLLKEVDKRINDAIKKSQK